MEFDFNDEQREIKSTAHDFIASRFKPEKVRELAESDSPYDDAIWNEICELGWPGIAIGEEHGGQGLGVVELVILQEEFGYVCAPVPFVANAYAGAVIEAAGSDEQKQRWLPGIASGEGRGAAELDCDGGPDRRRRRGCRGPRARRGRGRRSWSRPATPSSSAST